jgi:hypothetical protein
MNENQKQQKDEEKGQTKVPMEFQMKYMSNKNLTNLLPLPEEDSGLSQSLQSRSSPPNELVMDKELHEINKKLKAKA